MTNNFYQITNKLQFRALGTNRLCFYIEISAEDFINSELANFFGGQEFIVGFRKNYKEIMKKYLDLIT